MLTEASAWLRSRGIDQWPQRFPSASVQQQIARGESLLVLEAGTPIATIAVTDRNTEFWETDDPPAYYISRLAIARRAAGAGLGYRILDWITARAAADRRRYVRLATSSDNPRLRRYYEQAGFEHVADPPGTRWPTSLYQRNVVREL
ncbi:GNAT family N-acetyltransferase [Nocardia yamanashiensis]|uniref:GNAT family N-acetyltransferase n=1 Tax=Nocardia yamanashiensis TaxID=209247 RepID=UPI001E5BC1D1|nr:GNAT family N-acetyltransferase [Nocardia yamanashiensis]UGT44777.1 GNAT family N-acetyltransferase [Nocardia yamanashiensis]